eukprot:SAG11_NODE_10276_length_842_cov_1.643338_1_plen_69_part_10
MSDDDDGSCSSIADEAIAASNEAVAPPPHDVEAMAAEVPDEVVPAAAPDWPPSPQPAATASAVEDGRRR